MQLRVLGCHGGETPKHRTSSFLLGDEVAIDAGAITSMLSLDEQTRIRSVLISHPHMDHVRDLATLYTNQGRLGEADDLYRRSISILREGLGEVSHQLSKTYRAYSAMLSAAGRSREAAEYRRRANASGF